jgi:hypothetical protein
MDTHSVINVLSVDLENLKIKHSHYPNHALTKIRIEAYTKAIEVLKRFDGAMELNDEDMDVSRIGEIFINDEYAFKFFKNHEVYAIPKSEDE